MALTLPGISLRLNPSGYACVGHGNKRDSLEAF